MAISGNSSLKRYHSLGMRLVNCTGSSFTKCIAYIFA